MNYFVRKLYKAFLNSWNGLNHAVTSQWAFKVELVSAILIVPLAFYLGDTPLESIVLLGSVWLVLIVELINSAIEVTINRIGLEHHELSGLAKNLASAAVFLALINVCITWSILIFY